jgi:hypothetical protein
MERAQPRAAQRRDEKAGRETQAEAANTAIAKGARVETAREESPGEGEINVFP